jgi:hypothetical protein
LLVPETPTNASRHSHRLPVLIRLADVVAEDVPWLWPGRIPLGNLTLLEGNPGLGKSTVALDLAARVTRSASMPDDTPGIDGSVLLCTAEDSLAHTVRPRIEAAGGDIRRVYDVQAPVGADGDSRPLVFPDDDELLCLALGQHPDVRLVIVDPLAAFLSAGVDAHKDQDVRRVLARLKKIATDAGVAILLIRHLNKAHGGQAIARGGGSIGIGGAARSILLVDADPEAPDAGRVLASVKNNLAAKPDSLRFHIATCDRGSRVQYDGQSRFTADELHAANGAGPEDRSAREEASEWLLHELAEGPKPARDLKRAARDDGVSERTLDRAKTTLGVTHQRHGFGAGGTVVWQLPASHTRHDPSILASPAKHQERGEYGENGGNGSNPESSQAQTTVFL